MQIAAPQNIKIGLESVSLFAQEYKVCKSTLCGLSEIIFPCGRGK